MSEVLVLVDHADGQVRKSTLELLTFARRIGTPVAVFVGDAAAGEAAAPALGEHGAEKVLVASDPAYGEYLVAVVVPNDSCCYMNCFHRMRSYPNNRSKAIVHDAASRICR